MSLTVSISRNMPQKFSVADGGNSFILGRRAFFNNIFQSHQVENLGNNNSSTNSKKSHRVKRESGNSSIPILNKDSNLRIQRLRLTAVGAGSSQLKNANDKVSYKPVDHKNVINNAKTRVKGGGAAFVPKPNSIPKSFKYLI